MNFSGNYPISVEGSGTALAVEACRSCANGISGGLNTPSPNVANISVSNVEHSEQRTR